MTYEVDATRTEVPAIPTTKVMHMGGFSEPGSMRRTKKGYTIACPGCGSHCDMRCDYVKDEDSPSWQVDDGDMEDVTTLSLWPFIQVLCCCGWIGWLREGVYYHITDSKVCDLS